MMRKNIVAFQNRFLPPLILTTLAPRWPLTSDGWAASDERLFLREELLLFRWWGAVFVVLWRVPLCFFEWPLNEAANDSLRTCTHRSRLAAGGGQSGLSKTIAGQPLTEEKKANDHRWNHVSLRVKKYYSYIIAWVQSVHVKLSSILTVGNCRVSSWLCVGEDKMFRECTCIQNGLAGHTGLSI